MQLKARTVILIKCKVKGTRRRRLHKIILKQRTTKTRLSSKRISESSAKNKFSNKEKAIIPKRDRLQQTAAIY